MELFLFATVLICLIIASYTDILTREVPDYLSHSLLMVTIAFILIISIYNETYDKLIFALIGLIITLIIGLSLYYLNQWGGADAKILFSLGLTFGYIGLDYLTILLVLMVFVGALYSLIWGIIYFCKQWKKAIKQFKKILSQQKGFRIVNLCLSIITIVALFLPIKYGLKFLLIIFTLFFIFTYYLFIFTKTVESLNMIKKLPLNSVTDGDWLAKPVLNFKKKTLNKKDLEYLKKNKIKEIWIKVGIPFLPAILFATILTIIIYSMGLQFPLL